MGRPTQFTDLPNNNTSADFAEVERRAFDYVGQALGNMAGCGAEDLAQAAFSYAVQSFASSGILVRESYLRAKAAKWAAWWHTKHTASRTKRPHTKYSKAQALRGRVVSEIRRGTQSEVLALRTQLAALRGETSAQIADGIGRTARQVRRLASRNFSALLVSIICRTFGKSSAVFSKSLTAEDRQGRLANVRLGSARGQNPAGTAEDVAGLAVDGGEIERLGPQIAELLRAHWAAHPIPDG